MTKNISISINKLVSLLTLLLFTVNPIGIYFHIQNIIIIFYVIICAFLMFLAKSHRVRTQNSIILYLWIFYVFIATLSTLLFKRLSYTDLSGIYLAIIFTMIVYVLTRFWDPIYFWKMFRNLIMIIAVISLFGELLRFNPFLFIKQGTQFAVVNQDASGAISALFEFRHYYALYLVSALICLWEYPFNKFINNFWANGILLINLVLTYTRNAWIAFIVILIVWMLKSRSKTISLNFIIYMGFTVVIIAILFMIFQKLFISLTDIVNSRILEIVANKDTYGGVTGVRGYTAQYGVKYIFDNWQQYLLIGGGNGFALEWLQFNPFGLMTRWTNAIDVQYVTTFMNTGILGIVTLFVIYFLNIRKFVKSRSKIVIVFSLIVINFGIMTSFFDVIPFNVSPFLFWIICICGIDTVQNN